MFEMNPLDSSSNGCFWKFPDGWSPHLDEEEDE